MTDTEWNRKYPVGTRVRYFPIMGELETHIDSVTRSEAWTLGHGAAVVKIVGTAGGVSLSHLTVLPDTQLQQGE